MIQINEQWLNKPVMLFLRSGELFTADSYIGSQQSKFFLIHFVHNDYIEIQHLKKCERCSITKKLTFLPIDEVIMIRKDIFCGHYLIEDAKVKDCFHDHFLFHESMIIPFRIYPSERKTTIWYSNITSPQFGNAKIKFDKIPQNFKVTLQDIHNNQVTYTNVKEVYFEQCKKIILIAYHDHLITGTFKFKINTLLQ